MSKSATEIRQELALYQCCIADLAYNVAVSGALGLTEECALLKLELGVLLLERLKCFVPSSSVTDTTAPSLECNKTVLGLETDPVDVDTSMGYTCVSDISTNILAGDILSSSGHTFATIKFIDRFVSGVTYKIPFTITTDTDIKVTVQYNNKNYRTYSGSRTSEETYVIITAEDTIEYYDSTLFFYFEPSDTASSYPTSTAFVIFTNDNQKIEILDEVGYTDAITQDEAEAILEQLNDLCGCVWCKDGDELVDDTVQSGLLN